MDAVKNSSFFSDPEHQQVAEMAKDVFRHAVRELCEIYELEFGKSIRKPAVVKEIGPSNAPDKTIEEIMTE